MKSMFLIGLFVIATAFAPANSLCSLKVKVLNVKDDTGKILIALFRPENSEAFPENHNHIFQYKIVEAKKGSVSLEFTNLKPGKYAYAVLHDFNNNLKTDKNLVGYPIEPYGFSNNVKPLFSAPNFQECAFYLSASAEHEVLLIH